MAIGPIHTGGGTKAPRRDVIALGATGVCCNVDWAGFHRRASIPPEFGEISGGQYLLWYSLEHQGGFYDAFYFPGDRQG